MSKKFRNIENDEEFKNFRLEDYLSSMPKPKPKAKVSDPEQESASETDNLFPSEEEPDTSAIQTAVSYAIRKDELEIEEDDTGEEMKTTVAETDAPVERIVTRRISSKQRRLSLDEYRATYLRVPKITDRKPVFVSGEVRDRLDEIVRRLGGRGMSVSGLVENLARLHIEAYREDIEQWRKL